MIFPRRYTHPTLQPIQTLTIVRHHIQGRARTAAQYREGAELLLTLGLDVAAALLTATAEKLEVSNNHTKTFGTKHDG